MTYLNLDINILLYLKFFDEYKNLKKVVLLKKTIYGLK